MFILDFFIKAKEKGAYCIMGSKDKDPNDVRIGKNIQELRKEKGMSQQELAEKIGKDTKTISRYEKGNHAINGSTLEAISNVLEVPINKILDESYNAHLKENFLKILKQWDKEVDSMKEYQLLTLDLMKAMRENKMCMHCKNE